MEMAIVDCYAHVPLHRRVALHVMDSGKDPLKAASSGNIPSPFTNFLHSHPPYNMADLNLCDGAQLSEVFLSS